MRIYSIVIGALCAVLLNTPLRELPSNPVLDFYQANIPITGAKFTQCSELFYAMLARDAEVANSRMREMGCLNMFTGFFHGGSDTAEIPQTYVRLLGDLFVIRLPQFTQESGEYVDKRLITFSEEEIEQVQNIVIDLRGNPGGELNVARHFLSLLAPKGGMVYLRAPASNCIGVKPYEVTERKGVLADKHYTILVDQYTASVSELTAKTIDDEWYPNATTVIAVGADHTVGKSSLGRKWDMYGLVVPCGHWEIPGHPMIVGVGIVPDRVIDIPEEWGWDHDRIVSALGLSPRKFATAEPK